MIKLQVEFKPNICNVHRQIILVVCKCDIFWSVIYLLKHTSLYKIDKRGKMVLICLIKHNFVT